MRPGFIISFLRIASTILLYLLVLITLFVVGNFISKLISKEKVNYFAVEDTKFGNTFIDLTRTNNPSPFLYSIDKDVRYKTIDNLYSVEFALDSGIGYYYIAATSLFLGLGIFLLWNFKEIFREIQKPNPFTFSVVKKLRVLAAIFIGSEVIYFIHYFVFVSLIHHSLPSPELKLITERGDGIVIGLIIWAIAIVYQRGVEIYEENSLTV